MRALRAFGIAILTSIAGCFLAFFAGDQITQLLHVSNFEGGRGYMVVFVCAPIGIILGFIIGLAVSLCVKRTRFVGFLIAEGFALLISCVAAVVITGLVYLGIDKPPTIDGKALTLEFELKIPSAIKLPEANDNNMHASLYASDKDNRVASLDFERIQKREDSVIIPGTVEIMSHSSTRSLLATLQPDFESTQLFDLKLPGSPTKDNLNWTDWTPPTPSADDKPTPEAEKILVRYRVQQVVIEH